jgi:hypothetical protein
MFHGFSDDGTRPKSQASRKFGDGTVVIHRGCRKDLCPTEGPWTGNIPCPTHGASAFESMSVMPVWHPATGIPPEARFGKGWRVEGFSITDRFLTVIGSLRTLGR